MTIIQEKLVVTLETIFSKFEVPWFVVGGTSLGCYICEPDVNIICYIGKALLSEEDEDIKVVCASIAGIFNCMGFRDRTISAYRNCIIPMELSAKGSYRHLDLSINGTTPIVLTIVENFGIYLSLEKRNKDIEDFLSKSENKILIPFIISLKRLCPSVERINIISLLEEMTR